MGLNIKNERVHALAREAAAVTGLTQTGAIEEALVRLLAERGIDPDARRAAAKVDLVRSIALRYRSLASDDSRAIRCVEDLFDETSGLPR